MTWDIFWQLVRQFGVAGAFAMAFAWALWIGFIRPKREFDQSEIDTAQLRKDYERQLAELRRDLERQLTEITTDRNYYRDMTMELIQRYDREVQTSEAAVGTAVRALGRRRS